MTQKKTKARKPAAKKAKAPAEKKSKPTGFGVVVGGNGKPKAYSFDVLSDENDGLVGAVQESLMNLRVRKKNCPTGFKSMADVRHSMVPVQEFMVQWLIRSYGITEGTMVDIIGPEGIGKSTFAYWLMGGAMSIGIPCCIQSTEGKTVSKAWAKRTLSRDPAVAERMLSRMGVYTRVHDLNQMNDNLEEWVNTMRGRTKGLDNPVPMDTPLLHVVDTWSKLMSPGEAAGFYDYGDNMSKEKKAMRKGVNQGSNLEHSKWASNWCRRLAALQEDNNVILVLIHHQTTKIDMGAKAASYMSAESSALYNKNKIGGHATNQNTALQVILAGGGLVKDGSGDKIGMRVRARCEKNSYGLKNRVISWIVQDEKLADAPGYQAPNMRFDESFALFMADNKLFGTTVESKRFTSKFLGVVKVTAEEYKAAFESHPHAKEILGKQLDISGYEDIMDYLTKEEEAEMAREAAAGAPVKGPVFEAFDEEALEGVVPPELAATEATSASSIEDVLGAASGMEESDEAAYG